MCVNMTETLCITVYSLCCFLVKANTLWKFIFCDPEREDIMEFFQIEATQIPPSPECVSIEDIAQTYRITDHIFYLKLKVTRKNTQNP